MKVPQKIIDMVDRYWSFDKNQCHTHTWHDKQDCLKALAELDLPDLGKSKESCTCIDSDLYAVIDSNCPIHGKTGGKQ